MNRRLDVLPADHFQHLFVIHLRGIKLDMHKVIGPLRSGLRDAWKL